MSVALVVAGAVIDLRRDFRMLSSDGDMERPLVSTKFQVWKVPGRHIKRGGSRDWRTGARFRADASGASANFAHSVGRAVQAMRDRAARELLTFSRAPGQV